MRFTKRLHAYLGEWKNEILHHKELLILALLLLILAGMINYRAGIYTTKMGSAAVSDIILDNIAPINLTFLFVYGWMFVIAFFYIYSLVFKVNKLHIIISQFSLLMIVRSFFIVLTHLKTPPEAIPFLFPGAINLLAFQNDLFFSGHTAFPFLGFLVFKGEKIRYFFLIASIVLAITVLLMHQHYSIDVLSAYFITYGTYKIGTLLFGSIKN